MATRPGKRRFDGTEEEEQLRAEVARYCREHPRSPSAVRHPRVMIRGSSFIALLGSTLQDGIAGIGSTVEAALRAFDAQYTNSPKSSRS
ncbi:MAG TPA: hypothetical protein VG095_06230 [Chthoniobacterales bacterium]|nr:hypothetical protein [Chthoniobacterales bacterium]